MVRQVPILFLSDSPAMTGGLSRIGRDIACIASQMEEFRVGYLGRGVLASRKLPFMQYPFAESYQWGEELLQLVWEDFAGGEAGIVMSIWDPSRLLWFADPVGLPNEQWLRTAPFKRWGYFPVDSHAPSGALTAIAGHAVNKFDRVLAYGMWGSNVLSATRGTETDWLPHGINMDVFRPRDKGAVRVLTGIGEDTTLVGCVMTNQERKDWGLAFATIALLRQRLPKVKAWFKVDSIDRHWDLRALAADYGLVDVIHGDLNSYKDEELSFMYSACDVTFLPSLGEGFGYPIAESLACGVPVIHGTYGGGAELVPKKEWLVEPAAIRIDTRYNCVRPVYDPTKWADAIYGALAAPESAEFCRESMEHLSWVNLKMPWQKWLRGGLQ